MLLAQMGDDEDVDILSIFDLFITKYGARVDAIMRISPPKKDDEDELFIGRELLKTVSRLNIISVSDKNTGGVDLLKKGKPPNQAWMPDFNFDDEGGFFFLCIFKHDCWVFIL
jgi:hypothetical protein